MPTYKYTKSDIKPKQCLKNPLIRRLSYINASDLPSVMTLEITLDNDPLLTDKEEVENCLQELLRADPEFLSTETPLYFSLKKRIIHRSSLTEEQPTILFLNDIIITRNGINDFSLFFFDRTSQTVSLLIGHTPSFYKSCEWLFINMLPIIDWFDLSLNGGEESYTVRTKNATKPNKTDRMVINQNFYDVTYRIRNSILSYLLLLPATTAFLRLKSICHYYTNSGYDQLLKAYHVIRSLEDDVITSTPELKSLKEQLESLLTQQHENFIAFADGSEPTKSALPSAEQLEELIRLAGRQELNDKAAKGHDNIQSLLESLKTLKPLDEKESKKTPLPRLTNIPSGYFASSSSSTTTTTSSSIPSMPLKFEKKSSEIKEQRGPIPKKTEQPTLLNALDQAISRCQTLPPPSSSASKLFTLPKLKPGDMIKEELTALLEHQRDQAIQAINKSLKDLKDKYQSDPDKVKTIASFLSTLADLSYQAKSKATTDIELVTYSNPSSTSSTN